MTNILVSSQNIIDMLGLQSLPDDQKLAFVDRVSTIVQKRLVVRIYDFLSEADQKTFMNLVEQGTAGQLSEFFHGHAIDQDKLLLEEVEAVKKDLGEWADRTTK